MLTEFDYTYAETRGQLSCLEHFGFVMELIHLEHP
jgi:hypothetical protein